MICIQIQENNTDPVDINLNSPTAHDNYIKLQYSTFRGGKLVLKCIFAAIGLVVNILLFYCFILADFDCSLQALQIGVLVD